VFETLSWCCHANHISFVVCVFNMLFFPVKVSTPVTLFAVKVTTPVSNFEMSVFSIALRKIGIYNLIQANCDRLKHETT